MCDAPSPDFDVVYSPSQGNPEVTSHYLDLLERARQELVSIDAQLSGTLTRANKDNGQPLTADEGRVFLAGIRANVLVLEGLLAQHGKFQRVAQQAPAENFGYILDLIFKPNHVSISNTYGSPSSYLTASAEFKPLIGDLTLLALNNNPQVLRPWDGAAYLDNMNQVLKIVDEYIRQENIRPLFGLDEDPDLRRNNVRRAQELRGLLLKFIDSNLAPTNSVREMTHTIKIDGRPDAFYFSKHGVITVGDIETLGHYPYRSVQVDSIGRRVITRDRSTGQYEVHSLASGDLVFGHVMGVLEREVGLINAKATPNYQETQQLANLLRQIEDIERYRRSLDGVTPGPTLPENPVTPAPVPPSATFEFGAAYFDNGSIVNVNISENAQVGLLYIRWQPSDSPATEAAINYNRSNSAASVELAIKAITSAQGSGAASEQGKVGALGAIKAKLSALKTAGARMAVSEELKSQVNDTHAAIADFRRTLIPSAPGYDYIGAVLVQINTLKSLIERKQNVTVGNIRFLLRLLDLRGEKLNTADVKNHYRRLNQSKQFFDIVQKLNMLSDRLDEAVLGARLATAKELLRDLDPSTLAPVMGAIGVMVDAKRAGDVGAMSTAAWPNSIFQDYNRKDPAALVISQNSIAFAGFARAYHDKYYNNQLAVRPNLVPRALDLTTLQALIEKGVLNNSKGVRDYIANAAGRKYKILRSDVPDLQIDSFAAAYGIDPEDIRNLGPKEQLFNSVWAKWDTLVANANTSYEPQEAERHIAHLAYLQTSSIANAVTVLLSLPENTPLETILLYAHSAYILENQENPQASYSWEQVKGYPDELLRDWNGIEFVLKELDLESKYPNIYQEAQELIFSRLASHQAAPINAKREVKVTKRSGLNTATIMNPSVTVPTEYEVFEDIQIREEVWILYGANGIAFLLQSITDALNAEPRPYNFSPASFIVKGEGYRGEDDIRTIFEPTDSTLTPDSLEIGFDSGTGLPYIVVSYAKAAGFSDKSKARFDLRASVWHEDAIKANRDAGARMATPVASTPVTTSPAGSRLTVDSAREVRGMRVASHVGEASVSLVAEEALARDKDVRAAIGAFTQSGIAVRAAEANRRLAIQLQKGVSAITQLTMKANAVAIQVVDRFGLLSDAYAFGDATSIRQMVTDTLQGISTNVTASEAVTFFKTNAVSLVISDLKKYTGPVAMELSYKLFADQSVDATRASLFSLVVGAQARKGLTLAINLEGADDNTANRIKSVALEYGVSTAGVSADFAGLVLQVTTPDAAKEPLRQNGIRVSAEAFAATAEGLAATIAFVRYNADFVTSVVAGAFAGNVINRDGVVASSVTTDMVAFARNNAVDPSMVNEANLADAWMGRADEPVYESITYKWPILRATINVTMKALNTLRQAVSAAA